ncbi:hypothetical protein CBE01nite_29700 [Clostridium beijerinckii]|uniref:Uncharacterized protein n=1 Tax=Clostridium beijerinckii TaxID=1520 RepID=A0AB74VD74_CLOBE|nr:hypothetical protein [Clostridium beijerinckii]NRZ28750.1 hypothetical protein [Clostridium beijerinckii]NYB95474.1 hypothetical protein [Clostridium beijerinckii]OOM24589.1 hypothetical protein CLBEI_20500 [Clostridium beijerinckii]QUN34428.1 hypothetical protein KEC93_21265 [Clostridium beijerinckii]SQB00618.1 Uncharacterised protein [Clostridium beijerinckii]
MDWDKFKDAQDSKVNEEQKIKELKDKWVLLNQQCTDLYKEFDKLTYSTKITMENQAIADFKNYFKEKNFNISVNSGDISAVYGDGKIIFSINGDFGYGIHFYVGQTLQDCKVFSIDMAKEFYSKYKQLIVDEIQENSTLQFAEEQIKALENNINSIKNKIKDIKLITFIFDLDSHYSGMSGQFSNIQPILDTLKDHS